MATTRFFLSKIPVPLSWHLARPFTTSSPRIANSVSASLPARKPIGTFRGGLFGFLFGTTVTGSVTYFYMLQESKTSGELVMEDLYALNKAITHITDRMTLLEDKVALQEKRMK